MQKTHESVGERLVRIRKSLKLSRQQIADGCGVSRATISMWENNGTKMSAENLFKLAELLGLTVHELWFGQPEDPANAIPEFDRIHIRTQAQLKAQALQYLCDLRKLISELEPLSHVKQIEKTGDATTTASRRAKTVKPPS